ncbi:hypothetical protein FRC10_000985 [Ceratobasidium sp. 414]|nr:hypothetical protein FRC10_000985 [Ceratobasidium sp. 414]
MNSSTPAEHQTTTFEWTIRGLKEIFESTKGSNKSQAILSDLFGGGTYRQWQLYFYANSGDSGTHISLYLSAEPTQEEKDKALNMQ